MFSIRTGFDKQAMRVTPRPRADAVDSAGCFPPLHPYLNLSCFSFVPVGARRRPHPTTVNVSPSTRQRQRVAVTT